ncbi:phage tail protein, partial [Salmonella enterica subsp. houtenae]|nr:phage tail protein [Salmonella enterica subsp. houtenae]
MSTKFKTVITTAGAAKLAAATVPGGKKINLNAMAVGDGGGKLPVPDAGQTQLVNEVWRHTLNKISQDNRYSNYIVAELVIPPEVGGFWMRELGLYDDEGTLIAVANMAESYKPELAEGSGRAQTCRMVIIVSDVESVALSIDSTMVMATQDYVDDRLAEHEKSRRHPDATLKEKGFTQLSNATDSESETLAATPKAVKAAYDLADGKYTAQDATTTRKGIIQLSNATDSTSETLAATPKAVKAAMDNANGRLEKNSNGGDIPDIDLFVRNIGAARAFNGGINIGGDSGSWTTAEFITWLESQGAFNHPYWMCKGSWAYTSNKVITDTGCGNICLAGAVVEVMGTGGAITIRVTTPTTTSGGGVPSAQFIYINHGDGYAPGWRRDFSRTGDGMTGNLYLKNEGRINLAIVDEAETPRMWLFKDKGGDGVHINNGNDGGGDFIFGKEGSFYAPLAVRAGGSKMLSVRSDNNSALSAHFNLWGGGNRPTVIELDDEQGWHLYSQRNPDGTISFTVNGIVYCTALNVGGAIYQNNGDIYGSVWGNSWLSTWIHNNVVRGVRLGP